MTKLQIQNSQVGKLSVEKLKSNLLIHVLECMPNKNFEKDAKEDISILV